MGAGRPAGDAGGSAALPAAGMPLWEKAVWAAVALFLLLAFAVFWTFGWSQLRFPG